MRELLIGIALLVIGSLAASAAERTVKLAIANLTCALCPITVTKAIERVDGVTRVDIDFASKQAVVRFDESKTTWQVIAKASANAGYPASKTE